MRSLRAQEDWPPARSTSERSTQTTSWSSSVRMWSNGQCPPICLAGSAGAALAVTGIGGIGLAIASSVLLIDTR